MRLNLLIVEDDPLLAEVISDYFSSKDWNIAIASDGEKALDLFETKDWQLVLLDVMLPKQDGFSVCRQIRESSDVPVFFITARVMEEEELNGYALGADDYITKPFSLPVLYAKAMAMMGRVRGNDPIRNLTRGNIRIDIRQQLVYINHECISLPPLEYKMLLFFMENPNRVFTRDQLLIRFWGYDFDGNERVVDNHIKKLRKAISAGSCIIRTVRKTGYKMEVIK